MSVEKIKNLLQELQLELSKTNESIDSETASQMQEIDIKLQSYLDQQHQDTAEINDMVIQLEHQFKDKHPVAANIIQEALDLLAKVGI